MKSVPTFVLLAVSAPLLASAQATPAHPPARRAAGASAAASACMKLPALSPKIPAPPAGAACPRPLYTVTTVPSVRIDYTSPLEAPTLRETLGIESSTFSLGYVDTRPGTGEVAGQPGKWYTIHYTGYLTDGTKFDSSLDAGQPISIPYGGHRVIPGWDTGFDGMHVGGKRRLFIPYQLGYGANGKPPTIPAKAMLIFDVELLKISETEPPRPAPPTPPKPANLGTLPGSPSQPHPADAAPPAGTTPPASTTPPANPPAPGAIPAPAPGSNPSTPKPPADPGKPGTVPPTSDPTRPTSVPPKTGTTPSRSPTS